MFITKQILKVRSITTLLGSFVDKLPNTTGKDGRVHSTFKSIGADTGRMSSENPNVQNIPSHALDVRHQFRATPAMEKIDKCDVSENNISINLFDYDTIDLEDKADVKVKDLRVGDKVRLLKDKSEILAEITSLTNDAPYTLITMQEVMHFEYISN